MINRGMSLAQTQFTQRCDLLKVFNNKAQKGVGKLKNSKVKTKEAVEESHWTKNLAETAEQVAESKAEEQTEPQPEARRGLLLMILMHNEEAHVATRRPDFDPYTLANL